MWHAASYDGAQEQALRENLSGARNRRFPVRKAGPVSSTELLFAPDIEARLSESDHLEVLGKVVHDIAVPEVRPCEARSGRVGGAADAQNRSAWRKSRASWKRRRSHTRRRRSTSRASFCTRSGHRKCASSARSQVSGVGRV